MYVEPGPHSSEGYKETVEQVRAADNKFADLSLIALLSVCVAGLLAILTVERSAVDAWLMGSVYADAFAIPMLATCVVWREAFARSPGPRSRRAWVFDEVLPTLAVLVGCGSLLLVFAHFSLVAALGFGITGTVLAVVLAWGDGLVVLTDPAPATAATRTAPANIGEGESKEGPAALPQS